MYLLEWRIWMTRSVLLDKTQGSSRIADLTLVQTVFGDHPRHPLCAQRNLARMTPLAVQSRHLVDRVEDEAIWL